MKNPRILIIVIGGATALLTLVFGWLIWSGLSDRAEAADELENAEAQVSRLMQLPVRPCRAAIDKVHSNATLYANWRAETRAALAAGDRAFEPVTPPAFKTRLVDEARRLSSLPGTADGRIVKGDFPFGFKDYITGGVLPSVADLPRLQREWSDVVTVVGLLATNGVAEILDVRVAAAAAAEAASEPKAKKKGRKKAKAEDEPGPDVTRFEVDFLARPEALVAVVNGFAANARYIVVEDLRFAREKDALLEELGGEEKKSAAAAAPTSRRARRAAARAEAEAKAKAEAGDADVKTGVVTDPATAAPLKVTAKLAVYDFRTAGAKAGEKKEASK